MMPWQRIATDEGMRVVRISPLYKVGDMTGRWVEDVRDDIDAIVRYEREWREMGR